MVQRLQRDQSSALGLADSLLVELSIESVGLELLDSLELSSQGPTLDALGVVVARVRGLGHHRVVLHEGQVGIPPDLHEVYVQDLQLEGHASQVDEHEEGPYL